MALLFAAKHNQKIQHLHFKANLEGFAKVPSGTKLYMTSL